MIGAALLCVCLGASLEEAPIEGDCSADSAALAAEAEQLLASSGPEPPAETLRRVRELLRSARRLAPSPALALWASDLAFAAQDNEEGSDLLASAADTSPALLSPPELLLLGRRAQERRRWREAIARYQDLEHSLARRGEKADWIAPRVRELEVEARAEAIAPPSSGPAVEARLALADGKRALAAGRLEEARGKLRLALELSPDYAESFLALGALETRAGRLSPAIRAYRGALAAEPDRIEALTPLANLLWEEPDRRAKEESLALLDHAVSLRPDLRSLLRLSARRWADFGDAPKALERLDRFLERASAREREETQILRESLSRRVRGAPEDPPPGPAPIPEEPASAAIDRWRKAQVYLEQGGPDSHSAALALLAEAERLDPSFGRASELAAAIHEKDREWRQAEEALRRAIRADPSRAASYESLARVLEREPRRAAEALDVWRKAEAAGSTEALFPLAQSAERAGRRIEALRLYRRYRDEAPAGPHAGEAAGAVSRLEGERRLTVVAATSALVLALGVLLSAIYRRRSGLTFSEWLNRDPSKAQEARPLVGRLRHEVLKHGGMLLSDAAAWLTEGDAGARRATAQLLTARLYGDSGTRGLIAEAERALSELRSLARGSGVRLNLRHRDPVFSWLLHGLDALRRARSSLRRVARPRIAPEWIVAFAVRHLRRAAHCFTLSSGPEIERAVDRVAVLPVRVDALRALLARVAAEEDLPAPGLESIGALAAEEGLPGVRVSATDWETIWRNLFGNALEAGRQRGTRAVRLGLTAEKRRDPVTGEARLKLVLADDLEGAFASEEIHGRAAERGLGIVVEILRRSEGAIDVVPAPASGFTKGIALDLPAGEEPL